MRSAHKPTRITGEFECIASANLGRYNTSSALHRMVSALIFALRPIVMPMLAMSRLSPKRTTGRFSSYGSSAKSTRAFFTCVHCFCHCKSLRPVWLALSQFVPQNFCMAMPTGRHPTLVNAPLYGFFWFQTCEYRRFSEVLSSPPHLVERPPSPAIRRPPPHHAPA